MLKVSGLKPSLNDVPMMYQCRQCMDSWFELMSNSRTRFALTASVAKIRRRIFSHCDVASVRNKLLNKYGHILPILSVLNVNLHLRVYQQNLMLLGT